MKCLFLLLGFVSFTTYGQFRDLSEELDVMIGNFPEVVGTNEMPGFFESLQALKEKIRYFNTIDTVGNTYQLMELLDHASIFSDFVQGFGGIGEKKTSWTSYQQMESITDWKAVRIKDLDDGIVLYLFKLGEFRSYLVLNENEKYHHLDYEWKAGRLDGFGSHYLTPGYFTTICGSRDRDLAHLNLNTLAATPVD